MSDTIHVKTKDGELHGIHTPSCENIEMQAGAEMPKEHGKIHSTIGKGNKLEIHE